MLYTEKIIFLEREMLSVTSDSGLVYFGKIEQGQYFLNKQEKAYAESTTIFSDKLKKYLREYELFGNSAIEIKLDVEIGTDFQKKVWQALRAIPHGQIRSYQEIATAIGHPRAAQAVGSAVGKNPWLVITPCHRVLPKNGGIGQFSAGIALKRQLLLIEKITV